MEQSLALRIFSKIGFAIFAIALIDLVFVNWWIIQKQNNTDTTRQAESTQLSSPVATALISPNPSPDNSPTETNSNQPEVEVNTVAEKQVQTVIQNSQKEIFIPIGSGRTKSQVFTDLSGVEVTIDTSKYTSIDSVVFEAALFPEGGNGKAWARLINISDNNPFIESEISAVGASSSLKTSRSIPIPGGNKTYRVQAKTDIENFAAIVDNARIKITLK